MRGLAVAGFLRDAGLGFGRLELFPVHQDLLGPGDVDLAEHVGMAVDQLLHQPLGDIVDVPPAVIGRQLGVEHHLEQHIAELIAHRVVVVGFDRLDQLVRLLQEMASQRAMGLLGVPRASVGRP
jgi:hypothetical protein